MKSIKIISSLFVMAVMAIGCAPSADQLKKVLSENPEVLAEAIKANPAEIMTALNEAAQEARRTQAQRQEQDLAKAREDEFKNPKKPTVGDDRAVWGNKAAPITIVEYSDFMCGYCAKAHTTMASIKEKYGDKVRLVYKHLPVLGAMSEPTARYFEAIALQSPDKAYDFHSYVFDNQDKLRGQGKSFLETAVKKVGANLGKVKKDMNSDAVSKIIEADTAEARKFGFSGTPGFLVNGVSVRGAYPQSEFEKIIDRHLKDM